MREMAVLRAVGMKRVDKQTFFCDVSQSVRFARVGSDVSPTWARSTRMAVVPAGAPLQSARLLTATAGLVPRLVLIGCLFFLSYWVAFPMLLSTECWRPCTATRSRRAFSRSPRMSANTACGTWLGTHSMLLRLAPRWQWPWATRLQSLIPPESITPARSCT